MYILIEFSGSIIEELKMNWAIIYLDDVKPHLLVPVGTSN